MYVCAQDTLTKLAQQGVAKGDVADIHSSHVRQRVNSRRGGGRAEDASGKSTKCEKQ